MHSHHFSIEFFTPKNPEDNVHLRETRRRLGTLGPEFFSVTQSAGEAARARTRDLAADIQQDGLSAAPHIICIDASRSVIRDKILEYKALDIRYLVALKGSLANSADALGEFNYANELVEFIRAETGDWFHICVAAYPEMHQQAKSPQEDIDNFARKVNAGANAAITQMFYSPDAYFRFVEDVARAGIDVPVVPGIMPIVNYKNLASFASASAAEIPRWLRVKLESYGDDQKSVREFGLDVVTRLCERLLEGGAPGLHFFSLNEADAVEALFERLQASGYRT